VSGSTPLPGRTAYLDQHTSTGQHPAHRWTFVGCAVIVDETEPADLRESVRDVIAEKSMSAAAQAGGNEPTFSLLFRLARAPVRCVVAYHQGQVDTERIRGLCIDALLADRVERVVLPRSAVTRSLAVSTVPITGG
jgi:hypothetical protein